MKIVRCENVECPGWLEMRTALWPHCSGEEHSSQMKDMIADPNRFVEFVAYDPSGSPLGFAEASIRKDYVNGTESSPVAFLEGIYVVSAARRNGVARALVEAVASWGLNHGVTELASDALIQNVTSHDFHRSVGFEETERVVYFRKLLQKAKENS